MSSTVPDRSLKSLNSDLDAQHDIWVFGYGSLMWNPGFPFIDQREAVLSGFHRDFCLYSCHYRGTEENPGLVLGLDSGGQCRGTAFLVAGKSAREAVAYLNERELVSYAYLPRYLKITIGQSVVAAYIFVADKASRQYAGHLSMEEKSSLIMKAEGIAGLNRDYLINTVRHMESSGLADENLVDLLHEVERQTGALDMGGGI